MAPAPGLRSSCDKPPQLWGTHACCMGRRPAEPMTTFCGCGVGLLLGTMGSLGLQEEEALVAGHQGLGRGERCRLQG